MGPVGRVCLSQGHRMGDYSYWGAWSAMFHNLPGIVAVDDHSQARINDPFDQREGV